MVSPPNLIRHRIKEIELQPNVNQSKYPISLKVFVNEKEMCKLPPIEPGQPLKWSRPIICRDVTLQSKVSLEITEVHTGTDKHYKSNSYEISNVQSQTEITLAPSEALSGQREARITLLVPETVDQSYADVQKQLAQTSLPPTALDRLGKARDVLQAIVDFGNAVAELHPAAKMAFSVCTVVWNKLKEEQKIGKDTQDLMEGLCREGGIVDLAGVAKKYTKLEPLKKTIDDVLLLLEDVYVYVLERESKGGLQAIQRLFKSEDRDIVDSLIGKLKTLRMDFDSGLAVDTQMVVYSIDHEAVLDKLKPVDQSSFDLDNRECQDGTRKDLIASILAWVHSSPSTTSDSNTVLWIYGQAGIGKSAIAASLYKQLFQEGQLAAGFFCKYDDPRLQQPLEVINTIAYGLALCNRAYGEALVGAIKANRNLCTTPSMQLRYEGLIKKPLTLHRDASQPQPLVVLVDALDESGTAETRRNLIKYIWDLSQIVPWLKVVVTSRPDADIKGQIEKLGHVLTSHRNIHDFKASDDIHAYFQKELGDLSRRDEWPQGSIEQLRDKASGLFIWASTAKRFIADNLGPTEHSLRSVLKGQSPDHLDPLDSLYTQVIQNGMKGNRVNNREAFRRCIGAIVAVSTRQPLSLPDLCSMIQGEIDVTEMRAVVDRLSSVLHTDERMGGAIRFYHQSFVDFVKDPARSKDLCVDLEKRNAELARRCLGMMQTGLKFNICELETSCCFNAAVKNLKDRVDEAINGPLRYSCVYWVNHLVNAGATASERVSLARNLETSLKGERALYWVEALSLLGRLDVALSGLPEVLEWLANISEDARVRIMDLYRFTAAFYDAISVSTPHLYVSALALAPKSAEVCELKSRFPSTLMVTGGGDKGWPDWLKALSHAEGVRACAISRDSELVATGCVDNTVQLWDIRTGARIGEPLVGHSNPVTSVAFSPDGNLLCSGSVDKSVRMWDVKTRILVGDPLVRHYGRVTSIAFSPDSSLVVSGSYDNKVQMWDVKTRVPVGDPLVGHCDRVTSVAFSPDGSLVISGSNDNTVRVWDVNTRMTVGDPLVGHSNWVTSVAFSPDGSLVVSGSHDKAVRIWDVKTRMPVGDPLVGHFNWVTSVAFSPDGNRVASGAKDKTVRVWDVKTRTPVGDPLVGHSSTVTCVAFSPDGHLVVSGSDDKTIRVWHIETRIAVDDPLVGHSSMVTSVASSPDGSFAVSGSWDNTVRMWDVKTRLPVGGPLVGHSRFVTSVAFSPDGNLVCSGSEDNTVRMWDARTRTPVGNPLVGHSNSVTSVAFSPNGNLVCSGSEDKTVRMWDVSTRLPVGTPLVGHSGVVKSVAFSPNGQLVVSGSLDSTVRMWDVKTHIAVSDLFIGHSHRVTSVAFSPDGNLVVSGSNDNTVRIWDVRNRMLVSDPLAGHFDRVTSVAFSPDGNLICSGSEDKTVRVWDVKTRMPVGNPLVGHSNWVTSVVFSPDGSLVVSGSYDKTVRVWDVRTRMPIGDLLVGHSRSVTSVATSPNSSLIVSGPEDKTTRLWRDKAGDATLSSLFIMT